VRIIHDDSDRLGIRMVHRSSRQVP
jgi:hypothetical protein